MVDSDKQPDIRVSATRMSVISLGSLGESLSETATRLARGIRAATPIKNMKMEDVEMPPNVGPMRARAVHLLNNGTFQTGMITMIIVNVILMVVDTNNGAACMMRGEAGWETECRKSGPGQMALDCAFLAIYALELALRLYAVHTHAIRTLAGALDAVVVLVGFVEIALGLMLANSSSMGILRVASLLRFLRVLRLMRAARLLAYCPQLAYIVQGFQGAFITMGWGIALIFLLLTCISVVAVEFIAPYQAPRPEEPDWCVEAFSSVWSCMIFFFQISVAGDAWGDCSIPLIHENFFTSAIFVGVFCLVNLVYLNLILSAIIENAQDSHDRRIVEKNMEALSEKEKTVGELSAIFFEIDQDASGSISFHEFMKAYEKHERLREILAVLDVGKEDLVRFFRFLRTDSNEIDYQDFLHTMNRAFSQDMRTQVLFLKLQLSELGVYMHKLQHRIAKETADAVTESICRQLSQKPDAAPAEGGSCCSAPPPGCMPGSGNLGERLRRLARSEPSAAAPSFGGGVPAARAAAATTASRVCPSAAAAAAAAAGAAAGPGGRRQHPELGQTSARESRSRSNETTATSRVITPIPPSCAGSRYAGSSMYTDQGASVSRLMTPAYSFSDADALSPRHVNSTRGDNTAGDNVALADGQGTRGSSQRDVMRHVNSTRGDHTAGDSVPLADGQGTRGSSQRDVVRHANSTRADQAAGDNSVLLADSQGSRVSALRELVRPSPPPEQQQQQLQQLVHQQQRQQSQQQSQLQPAEHGLLGTQGRSDNCQTTPPREVRRGGIMRSWACATMLPLGD